MEVALAHALVRQASDGAVGPTLRVYRPAAPVVAFGRRDTLLPGFADALAACRAAGFTPVVRAPGGRAVAYTEDSLVLDHVVPDPTVPHGLEKRFQQYGEAYAAALRGLGVDARVGEVPGEYCPGAHSVNARGQVKLVGTAQRIVRRAWLFSAVVVLDGGDRLRPVLREVYTALGQPFDETSVGSLREEGGEARSEVVLDALLSGYRVLEPLEPGSLGAATRSLAAELVRDHRV